MVITVLIISIETVDGFWRCLAQRWTLAKASDTRQPWWQCLPHVSFTLIPLLLNRCRFCR